MDYKDNIKDIFYASIEAKEGTLEDIGDNIITAGDTLAKCLLEEGKILVYGEAQGASHLDAQRLVAYLLGGFNMQRPALPAILLEGSPGELQFRDKGGTIGVIDNENSTLRQIEALADQGDALVWITSGRTQGSKQISEIIQGTKGMTVIILSGESSEQVPADNNCLELRVSSNDPARIKEVHLLIIHCLLYLLEKQIFSS